MIKIGVLKIFFNYFLLKTPIFVSYLRLSIHLFWPLCDYFQPIRGQCPGRVITLDPSEASVYLLGELARLVGGVEDLVVEHGEVEGEPQSDGVCGLHLGLADLKSVLVGFLRVVNDS